MLGFDVGDSLVCDLSGFDFVLVTGLLFGLELRFCCLATFW